MLFSNGLMSNKSLQSMYACILYAHVDVISLPVLPHHPLDPYTNVSINQIHVYIGISTKMTFTAAHPKQVPSLIFFGTRASFKRSVLLLLATAWPNHHQELQQLPNKEWRQWHPMHVLPQQQQQLDVDLQLPPKMLAQARGQNQIQWLAAKKGKQRQGEWSTQFLTFSFSSLIVTGIESYISQHQCTFKSTNQNIIWRQ